MRTIFIFIIIFIVLLQLVYANSYQSKTNFPSVVHSEASQWLSTHDPPRRWRQQYTYDQASDEVNQALNRLQSINDNGIHQYNSQSFDGVPMEVLYELSRKGGRRSRH
ncbi:unnamed protein product [Adineta steineri]|uniref:Uncharacterized protein n=1 Tax=Adineta steineri TaxID=433720 RepID=A0A818JH23_9BILA|nr:unnamed protein product [Adineta steineri]